MKALVGVALMLLGWALRSAHAEEEPEQGSGGRFNWPLTTWGGKQYWSDERIRCDWRIQRNAVTGHCRLIDDRNVRRAWGSFAECDSALEAYAASENLPETQGRVVVLLHGLAAHRGYMTPLGMYLRDQGGYSVVNVSYASTRGDFCDHARSLGQVLSRLDRAEEINFVCHSLGNLVLRQYLTDELAAETPSNVLPRIERVVMLAPPNNGAQLAERFRNMLMLKSLAGGCTVRLARDGQGYTRQLAKPPGEFGIIAGGQGDDAGQNPFLAGDDDLVVRVAETRLAGATDFMVLPVRHRSLLQDTQVHRSTLEFLRHGYFRTAQERQPIGAE